MQFLSSASAAPSVLIPDLLLLRFITRTAGPGFPSQVIFSNFANTKQRGAGIEQVSLQPRQYGAVPTRLSNLV
jgi:hypothetical protein